MNFICSLLNILQLLAFVLVNIINDEQIVTFVSGAFHDRKIFVSQFGNIAQIKSVSKLQQVRNQIRQQALKSLYELPDAIKTELVHQANKNETYPVKTAYEFMEFFRNGNRAHYEAKIHSHQGRIRQLVIGNLLVQETEKNQSMKYVDEIVNGIWMLMEESTWSYPAHLYLQGTQDHLPNPTHLSIDLNAGEVAKLLGWVKLLMEDKFDSVSTVINKRIDYELRNRIFEGYLKLNFGWEGFTNTHSVNNWNIWVNGNILKSAVFTLNDLDLFDKVFNKTLYSGRQ